MTTIFEIIRSGRILGRPGGKESGLVLAVTAPRATKWEDQQTKNAMGI